MVICFFELEYFLLLIYSQDFYLLPKISDFLISDNVLSEIKKVLKFLVSEIQKRPEFYRPYCPLKIFFKIYVLTLGW